ncbi:MAG: DUF4956 domain-containing protein [Verrucomicrobiales bacterium]|nr:DUF4956 domain-containing protein [Verrucomicrobiales bacterium]
MTNFVDQLKVAVHEGAGVPTPVLIARLVLAFFFGISVAWLYRSTRNDGGVDSLPATLVLLAVLIGAVTQVIGENVARAFSLVGALSIVRFRTVVRDTRDTAFVIFSVVVGMGVGAGHSDVALITLVIGGIAAWVMAPGRGIQSELDEYELSLKIGVGQEADLFEKQVFSKHLKVWRSSGASTAKQGAALEVVWVVAFLPGRNAAGLVRDLNRQEGVQGVEIKPHDPSA